jgi:hypothetical protein
MATHHHEIVDLTGASALAPGETRIIPNPVERVPDVIFVDLRTGDAALVIDPNSITAQQFSVENPGVNPNESVLLVWHWHTRTR